MEFSPDERLVEEPEGEGVEVVRYAGVCDAFWGCEEAKIAATSFSSWMLRLRRTPVRGCAQRVMEQLLRGWRYLCPYLSV